MFQELGTYRFRTCFYQIKKIFFSCIFQNPVWQRAEKACPFGSWEPQRHNSRTFQGRVADLNTKFRFGIRRYRYFLLKVGIYLQGGALYFQIGIFINFHDFIFFSQNWKYHWATYCRYQIRFIPRIESVCGWLLWLLIFKINVL